MDITATCAEITVTFPGGSASFNKEITTTEIVVAQNPESEDRVYLNQNSANAPLTFWWNLNKAIEFGYNTLQELYDYFVAEIASQCGGGGIESIVGGTNITVDATDPQNPIVSASGSGGGGSLPDTEHLEFFAETINVEGNLYELIGIRKKGEPLTAGGFINGALYDSSGDMISILVGSITDEMEINNEGVTFRISDGNRFAVGGLTEDASRNKILCIDDSGKFYFRDASTLGGGGGDIFITKTKAEIDALISTNALVKGATYKITGVHPTLYNDGTNSGTTILLKAISENVLETQGTGIFYNPKYNQAVDGFGIWDNKMYGTFSTIVGTFDYQNKETVTADNSATGILLADGMIQFVSGNWGSATSITGGTSSATANVADFVSPSYAVNDKVIWGGYSWTNVNGNIGASTDVLNLDSEWSKDVYDTTNYKLAYDLIEYDYANDWIGRRYEIASNVDVKITKSIYAYFAGNYGIIYSSISVQQFGNSFDYSTGKGILNKYLDNAYDESINFSGSSQYNLTFGQNSFQQYLTFGQNSDQTNLIFGQSSSQQNLTFGQSSSQQYLTFGQSSFQQYLTFGQNSDQTNLIFGQSSSQQNLTFGQSSSQQYLTFGQSSFQQYLTFGQNSDQTNLIFGQSSSQQNLTFGQSSSQYNLTFGQSSSQQNLTFGQSSSQQNLTFGQNSFQTNLIFGQSSSQQYLTFGQNSFQQYLTFGQNSFQTNLIFGQSSSQYNLTFGQSSSQYNLTFGQNSKLNFNNQILYSNMEYIDFKTKDFTVPGLSSATYIFDSNIKEVYQRPDGTIKLKFMNNSDVLEVHGIAD